MRLLRANSINSPEGLQLVSLTPDEIKPYAILSHTWGKDEVLYTDVVNGTAAPRAAYNKVRWACYQALVDDLEYVWVDTCCIDKSSSAELSEAVNSMFAWYRDAKLCYAYLSDYSLRDGELGESRWFTRGWTLQELIAPRRVVFYDRSWLRIGDKQTLREEIAETTRIDKAILSGERSVDTASIANRMGWASHRSTARPEDMAYCLMGIFSINMPLLYGEGSRAFQRLQEEIMKHSTDHTLFVWKDESAPEWKEYGMLAPSPRHFARTGSAVPYQLWEKREPYSMTNAGLAIKLRIHTTPYPDIWIAALDCPPLNLEEAEEEAAFAGVYLKKTGASNEFSRVHAARLGYVDSESSNQQQIYIKPSHPTTPPAEGDMVYPKHYICMAEHSLRNMSMYKVAAVIEYPSGYQWSRKVAKAWLHGSYNGRILVRRGARRLSAAMVFMQQQSGKRILVIIGSLDALRLGFDARELDESSDKIPGPKAVQEAFQPEPLGQTVGLTEHSVRVCANIQIRESVKYYFLEIHIDPKQAAAATPTTGGTTATPAVETVKQQPKNVRPSMSSGQRMPPSLKLSGELDDEERVRRKGEGGWRGMLCFKSS